MPGIYPCAEEAEESALDDEDEDVLTSQAGNSGGVAVSLNMISTLSFCIEIFTHIRISKAACFLSCLALRRYACSTSGLAV